MGGKCKISQQNNKQTLVEIHYITLQYYESTHKSNKKCTSLKKGKNILMIKVPKFVKINKQFQARQ